jgi:hypothetical protein
MSSEGRGRRVGGRSSDGTKTRYARPRNDVSGKRTPKPDETGQESPSPQVSAREPRPADAGARIGGSYKWFENVLRLRGPRTSRVPPEVTRRRSVPPSTGRLRQEQDTLQEGTKLSPRPTTSIQDPFSSLECMQGFVITWPALSMESKHAMHTNTVAPIRLRLPPLTAHRSRLSRPSASPLDAVP